MTNQHKDLITQITKKIRAINDKIALVKKDEATVVLDKAAYGEAEPPKSGNFTEGQIYFHIIKEVETDTENTEKTE